ncbi:amidase signature domain-containing protein [Lasiosphaeria ovina]|uniref:Amidase signature domain-containing protein n=1 Tax=Lasiosphaeria ovina TaxID=92902 RepID=A0AAE0JZ16_9PEZI|nr:amidase signature domain-containing protein [Lasiosphaeria ovina]
MAKFARLVVHGLAMASLARPSVALSDHFDVREATVDGVHGALLARLTTCREVVSAFIARIEHFNPILNAVISLNPDALLDADQMDGQIASGNMTGALFCIPVLLKDNYNAVGMNTTGGCLDLANNRPLVDAPTVKALKRAGAIILGKTNLHELALEGLTVSSLGGQTVNPYDLTRTPGGSSGGAGAAIAASFAVVGTGTDTVNSLRSPASAGSLFSFRPTRGLISRVGVIPVSYTQDVVGAFARNLQDLAVAMTVMVSVGFDPRDNATALMATEIMHTDHSRCLLGGSLKGLRLGLVDGFFDHTSSPETPPVDDIMAGMVSQLTAAGAEVVNITETIYNSVAISAALDVQVYEYRELLDTYLAGEDLSGEPRPKSFKELYRNGSGEFLVIPSQHAFIEAAFRSSTSNTSYFTAQRGIQNLTQALKATFARDKLDALIYPEQKNLVVTVSSQSQAGRNGILASLTGSPVVTVPAGFSSPTEDALLGVPVGMEILGQPWTECLLLNIARHVSDLVPVRRIPAFANMTVETKVFDSVPVITPNSANIAPAYPVGVF